MINTVNIVADKDKTMLIIGKAATKQSLKDISYETSKDEVLERYGDCDLTDAFNLAKDNGAEHIFLMNIQEDIQYLEIVDILQQVDFAYIVFVDLYLSDTFNDAYNGNLKRSYIAFLLGSIGNNSDSVFVVTDKSASLYEDIDAYLKAMNDICEEFESRCTTRANKENILFIGNNSKTYTMPQIIIASILCSTEPYEYPIGGFGEAYFDIDERDDVRNFSYFKNHVVRGTTIENFVNFLPIGTILKSAEISRVIKSLGRFIDFTEFLGKRYSTYQKLCIKTKLQKFLEDKVGTLIQSFKINSVEAYKDTVGSVLVLLRFTVMPVGTTEQYTIEREVQVG